METLKRPSNPRIYERLRADAELRRQIADLLVAGKSTLDISKEMEEQHGKGFNATLYQLIDSAPKAIRFVKENRPDSTNEEIKRIWFNANRRNARHFDNL